MGCLTAPLAWAPSTPTPGPTVSPPIGAGDLWSLRPLERVMRKLLPLSLGVLGAFLFSQEALAGGVGVFGAGGLRQAPAYYYRDDGVQFVDFQNRGASSFGAEFLLGDRDDKLQGVMRAFGIFDAPVETPEDAKVTSGTYTFEHPDYDSLTTSTTGSATVGLQWSIWGDPSAFQVVATTMMGAGFITRDSTEFAILQPGAGVTYTLDERFQFIGTVNYNARFRKTLSSGGEVLVGFRYMID